ncbi:MAG: division/cell wall cluster transcriptional repressor MraZ [Armatimonadota bacterium]|nr:division/cell wall cluster transcriptional repressor MraZ [bacterium]MDW8319797.1 division/cell wall cluster transcriptional repressor MraZ [Armatimonadota bacterium]
MEATGSGIEASPLALLQGYSEHSVDDKGRIIMPQRFRELFGRTCVITQGLHGSLFVFHLDTWHRIRAHLARYPFMDENAVRLQRFFISPADSVDIDSQGRLAIPAHLREYARISLPTSESPSTVVIVGAPYRLEIWSKQRWKEVNSQVEDTAIFHAAATLGVKLDL